MNTNLLFLTDEQYEKIMSLNLSDEEILAYYKGAINSAKSIDEMHPKLMGAFKLFNTMLLKRQPVN